MENSLVFKNANIITMNHAHPRARAMAIDFSPVSSISEAQAQIDAFVERVLRSGIHLGIQPPFNYHFGGHQRLDTSPA